MACIPHGHVEHATVRKGGELQLYNSLSLTGQDLTSSTAPAEAKTSGGNSLAAF